MEDLPAEEEMFLAVKHGNWQFLIEPFIGPWHQSNVDFEYTAKLVDHIDKRIEAEEG